MTMKSIAWPAGPPLSHENTFMLKLKFILAGIVAISAIGAMFFWPETQGPSAVQTEIVNLTLAYDDAIYVERDYETAKGVANQIVNLASNSDDPKAIEVRGLIRLAYLEIAFGKCGNCWEEKIEKCEKLVSDEPSIDRVEFLLYAGCVRGKFQGRFELAHDQLLESLSISKHIKDDRTLALTYMELSELYAFLDRPNLVMRNAYRGVTVARHHGQKSLLIRMLRNLIHDLVYLDKFSEAAERGEELIELVPNSYDANYALFLTEESDEFVKLVESRVKTMNDRQQKGQAPTRHEIAVVGKLLKQLARAYVLREDFSRGWKYTELAIPYLKIVENQTGFDECSVFLQMDELELAQDVDKIDRIASIHDGDDDYPNKLFMEILAKEYANLGAAEKSLYWQKRAIELREKRHANDTEFFQQSSEKYWESELRLREQAELGSKIEARSRRLNSALVLGATVCGLLSCFYFGLTRERKSLDETVKVRTKSLSEAMHKASAADHAKSDFLVQINHEIRNPLTAILSYCELLSSSSEGSNEFAAGIESSSIHLSKLVDKILEVSQIEWTGLEADCIEFSPKQTVDDIRGIMVEQVTRQGLEFECTFKGDASCLILSDETKIRQVALNLIGNAIKFTEDGNVIASFELTKRDDLADSELVIDVKDTGIGIAKSESAAVFDRFTKASNGNPNDGSGLGLFITKRLVSCMGGEIALDSELGVGTHVRVSLPVKVSNSSFEQHASPDFKNHFNSRSDSNHSGSATGIV